MIGVIYHIILKVSDEKNFCREVSYLAQQRLWFLLTAAASNLSCVWLCDSIDGSPPDSPVPGILQARTLEWVAISFSNAWKEKWKWSCLVVSDSSDPMDYSPPGSSIHGIFQVRVLEWVAIVFSILFTISNEKTKYKHPYDI